MISSMFEKARIRKSRCLSVVANKLEKKHAKLLPAKGEEKTAGNTKRQVGRALRNPSLAFCLPAAPATTTSPLTHSGEKLGQRQAVFF